MRQYSESAHGSFIVYSLHSALRRAAFARDKGARGLPPNHTCAMHGPQMPTIFRRVGFLQFRSRQGRGVATPTRDIRGDMCKTRLRFGSLKPSQQRRRLRKPPTGQRALLPPATTSLEAARRGPMLQG